MYKGIFWSYILWFDDDMYVHHILPVYVHCDLNGTPSEPVEFSSKSGENFNHKVEWEKKFPKQAARKPYNHFPRGRVEIKNGTVKIYANPVILEDEESKELIIETFELESVKENIKWIADNSKHYSYVVDAMGG